MDKADLLKELTEKRYDYFASIGLSPVKCRQLVIEQKQVWQKLTEEELADILARGEYSS